MGGTSVSVGSNTNGMYNTTLIIRMRFVCFQSIRKETIRILIFIGNTMPVLIQGNMSVEKVE